MSWNVWAAVQTECVNNGMAFLWCSGFCFFVFVFLVDVKYKPLLEKGDDPLECFPLYRCAANHTQTQYNEMYKSIMHNERTQVLGWGKLIAGLFKRIQISVLDFETFECVLFMAYFSFE